LKFGLICSQFFGPSSGEFKNSLAVVNQCAARLLLPGVFSATLLGIQHFSALLDKSYGFKDDWYDPTAIAGELITAW
jgi:hypothetical protein